jgi:hypothetical protein
MKAFLIKWLMDFVVNPITNALIKRLLEKFTPLFLNAVVRLARKHDSNINDIIAGIIIAEEGKLKDEIRTEL